MPKYLIVPFLLAVPASLAAREPEWSGAGNYRLRVRVEPVELSGRPDDEMVARCALDLPRLLKDRKIEGQADPASLQVHRCDPETGAALPFRTFDSARSRYDRPCRFDDDAIPDAYPDRVGAASDAPDGRPPVVLRDRGGRLFNRATETTSGHLAFVHTQSADAASEYCVYFNVLPNGSPPGQSPAPWLGDADLYRRETGAPLCGMSHFNICAADFNGDGLFDLFAGVEKGQLMYFPNAGQPGRPKFTACQMLADESGPIDAGWYCNPFVTDWDGDTLPDLLVGTMHNVILWWKNTGTRTQPKLTYKGFVQAEGRRLAVPETPVAEDTAGIFKVDYFNAPTVCDWNADGLPDLLTGGYTTGRIFYYRCTGRDAAGVPLLQYVGPLEADARVIDTGWSATPTVADFDSDGDPDLITGSWDFQKGHNPENYLAYFENTGSRESPRLTRKPFPKDGDFPRNIIARAGVADWNNDGLPDLLVSDHSGTLTLLANHGTRTAPRWSSPGETVTGTWCFVPLNLSQGPEDYIILTYDYMITSMGDLNGDGETEIMSGDEVFSLAGSPNAPRLVRRGELTVDGRKLLNPGPGYGDEYNWNVSCDWDRDGRTDILCGTQQGNIVLHRGTGELTFTPGIRLKLTNGEDLQVGPPVYRSAAEVKDFTELQGSRIKFVVADVDGDKIDDLVVTETYGNIWVFRNTKTGGADTLEPGVKAVQLSSRARINTIDWNRDGKPDMIDGLNPEKPGSIHINASTPGRIAFEPPISPLKLPWMFYGAGFFPTDWNRDGDEDLLVQSEFYLFWVERSFLEHGYRQAVPAGAIESRPRPAARTGGPQDGSAHRQASRSIFP